MISTGVWQPFISDNCKTFAMNNPGTKVYNQFRPSALMYRTKNNHHWLSVNSLRIISISKN
jgi:hypothetical protein